MTMGAIKWLGGLLLLVASSAWSASEWQSLTAAQRDVLAPLAERWDQMPDEERERFLRDEWPRIRATIGGVPVFECQYGTHNDKYAIRIEECLRGTDPGWMGEKNGN